MMNQVAQIAPAPERKSIIASMADRFGMEPAPFEATLRATVVPEKCTREQFAAFLMVAREYHLNPLTKEIYAFPARAGGIQPIVSIDGWMQIINSHPQMDGMEFEDILDGDNKLLAIRCTIYRKDRKHPTTVIEYLGECRRPTDTWKTWPARMLRHKAAIQCARYAFGFSGIVEPDEFERMDNGGTVTRDVTPPSPPPAPKVEQETVSRDAEDVVSHETPSGDTQPDLSSTDEPQPFTPEQLVDLSQRLANADEETKLEIWECEIDPAAEAGRIDKSDLEALRG